MSNRLLLIVLEMQLMKEESNKFNILLLLFPRLLAKNYKMLITKNTIIKMLGMDKAITLIRSDRNFCINNLMSEIHHGLPFPLSLTISSNLMDEMKSQLIIIINK